MKNSIMVLDVSSMSVTQILELEETLAKYKIASESYMYDKEVVILCDEESEDIHSFLTDRADYFEESANQYMKIADQLDRIEDAEQIQEVVSEAKYCFSEKERMERLMDSMEPLDFN